MSLETAKQQPCLVEAVPPDKNPGQTEIGLEIELASEDLAVCST